MASHDAPEGWGEPLHEPLLYPATFYGAPRPLILIVYFCAMPIISLLAINSLMMASGLVFVGALVLHVVFAVASRLEPFWIQIVIDWWDAPKEEVEP